jgi:hypothetical protein
MLGMLDLIPTARVHHLGLYREKVFITSVQRSSVSVSEHLKFMNLEHSSSR